MSPDSWKQLSDWHSAWLQGNADERRRLRDQLASTAPDLVVEADALAAASMSMSGFLETPAFVLTAAQLASDEAIIEPGTLVGPYRIDALLGRGGVGVVYRATDTRLNRRIALKALAPLGVHDEMSVQRFLREARITASLDHPNIVRVYDVGTHDGQPFMVVELLEGETLRQRLSSGRLGEPEVRRIGVDIARGLVAAHTAGLVHRDLKPENIFLTRGGLTRILDFGIAKLVSEPTRRGQPASTITGTLVGTAGYLAPEQIRGDESDGRADLFALGAILFEMLTGQRAFARENTVDTLHAIVHESPPDLLREGADISWSIETIVQRLLEKAPEARFQTAADLIWALEQPSAQGSPARKRREPVGTLLDGGLRAGRIWLAAVAAVCVLALTWFAWALGRRAGSAPTPGAVRFSWALPSGTGLSSAPAVSPDGRRVVWAGAPEAGPPQLYVRDLAGVDAVVLAGTTGARHPFWSPDGRWIGFFSRGKLRKIAAAGGPAVEIADAPEARGGTWSPAGVIVFQPNYRDSPLFRVSDQGGLAQPVTTIAAGLQDVSHRWPSFLPDGRRFLYLGISVDDSRRGVYVGSLDTAPGRRTGPILQSDSAAVYGVPEGNAPGLLLSARDGRLEARSFDTDRLTVTGDVRALEAHATATTPHHPALIGVSTHVLAYASSVIPYGGCIARVDRDGSRLHLGPENLLAGLPRLSPNGRFLARQQVDAVRSNPDIWVEDLERGSTLRLTTSADHEVMPVWSPDGAQVAYVTGTIDNSRIGFASADGSGVRSTVACPKSPCSLSDWTPDGRLLVLTIGGDVWTMTVQGGEAQPLLSESFVERDGRTSPDGRWLAYVSDETGRPEVSLRSLTGAARRYVVSSGGGDQPVWRADGSELFFTEPPGRLVSVSVRPSSSAGLTFGPAIALKVPTIAPRHLGTTYDISKDGRTVHFMHPGAATPPREIGILLGWGALVK